MKTGQKLAAVLGSVGVVALLGLAISTRDTGAYDSYSDGSTSVRCAQCHEIAVGGGFQSRGPLHDAHNASGTGTCSKCHAQNGDVPLLSKCIGCHGQPGTAGAGLRKHHALAGAPPDGDGLVCADCHSDPTPAPESAVPAYYGQADVVQTTPCNTDGKEDFWSNATGAPDLKGLDNDGDLLIDALDPDCAPPEVTGVVFASTTTPNRLSWTAQLPAGQLYDVIRSDGPQFPAASANTICLINNTASTFADDLVTPALGRSFFYLVRNSLVANYGRSSNGTLRVYTTCP